MGSTDQVAPRKKVCKILSDIVTYIIEGAILHRLQYS